MPEALCRGCGEPFEQDVSWKVRCIACWRLAKDADAFTNSAPSKKPSAQAHAKSQQPPRPQQRPQPESPVRPRPQPKIQPQPDTTHYQQQINRLRQEVETLRMQLILEKNKTRPVAKTGGSAIPDDMLGRLIRLAHPDRHGNSEASNKATAWLLSQRKDR